MVVLLHAYSCLVMQAVVSALVAAGVWVKLYASDGTRAALEDAAAPVVSFCSSSIGWARDKVTGASQIGVVARHASHVTWPS